MHAASGAVSVQAQNAGKLSASAQKAVTLASAQAARPCRRSSASC
ncbi:hypothetical protein [Burkholderia thailandensis]|nr:hypothetical protein [Burkholderia thailandensis]